MPKGPKAQFTSTNSSDDDSSEYEYGVIGMVSDARKVELMSTNDKNPSSINNAANVTGLSLGDVRMYNQARRNNSRRRDASSSELTTTTPSQDRRAITTYTPPPRPVTAHGHRVEAPKPNVSPRQVQAPSHRSSTPGPNAPFTQDQRRSSTTQPQYHTPAASRFQPWRDQSGEFHPPQSPPPRSATSHGHRAATASLGQWQGQAPIERSRTPHAQHLGGRVPFQRDPEQVVHRTDQHMPTRTGASGGATSYASQGGIQADMRHLNEPIPQQRRHYDSVSADYSTIRSVPTSMGPSGRVDPQVEGTNTSGKRPPRMLRSVVGILRSKI